MTAPTVKVQPLVWNEYGEAKGGGAKYSCYEVRDGWNSVCYPFEGQQYRLAEGVPEQVARDAAQADYEARILSAIDTTDFDAHIGAVLEETAGEADQIAAFPRPVLWNYVTTPTARDLTEWKGRQEAAEDIAVQIRAIRPGAMQALERVRREARVEGMRAALAAAEAQATERCAKCGAPRNAHHYRHPFVSSGFSDPLSAIRALIAAEERGEGE